MFEKTEDSYDLSALVQRLDRWRRRYGRRGRRIPEELWNEAAEAAQALGVEAVARALRLRRGCLEKRVTRLNHALAGAEPTAEFLEVQLPSVSTPFGLEGRPRYVTTVLWFEASDGRRLRLEVPAETRCRIDAIFAAFREVAR